MNRLALFVNKVRLEPKPEVDKMSLTGLAFQVWGKPALVSLTGDTLTWTYLHKSRSQHTLPVGRIISLSACTCPEYKVRPGRLTCPCTILDYGEETDLSSVITGQINGVATPATPAASESSEHQAPSVLNSSSGYASSSLSSSSRGSSPSNNAVTADSSPQNADVIDAPPPIAHEDHPMKTPLNGNVGEKINLIRIYYVSPVGEHRFKPSHLPLVPIAPESVRKLFDLINKHNSSAINIEQETSQEAICDLIRTIRDKLDGLSRPKRLLAFINPHGGKRFGVKIFREKVLPLLQLAQMKCDYVITDRANHARDVLLDPTFPLLTYSGILCVGGDGMFSELLNGLIVRVNNEAGVDINGLTEHAIGESELDQLVVPSMPIGIIPAGSTDAVAFGTSGINDPVTSTIHIILGNRINLDVCGIHSVQNKGQLIRFATSFMGYGYFGDLMARSENMRWLGPKRYDVSAVKQFMNHSLYEGEVKMLVSSMDMPPNDKPRTPCLAGCHICRKALERRKETSENLACITVKGRFVGLNAATMACRCDKAKRGISPTAHLGDGCTDLIMVSDCSRLRYLQYLIRTGFSAKSPFDLDFVDVYRVREFQFHPKSLSDPEVEPQTSVWNCDGEIISEPAIHVRVHCQLISVFGTGPEKRQHNKHADRHQKKTSIDAQATNVINGKESDCSSSSRKISFNLDQIAKHSSSIEHVV